IGDDAEPAEGINPLVGSDCLLRHGTAADAVVTVATRDEIAIDPVGYAVLFISDIGLVAVKIMRLHICSFIDSDAAGSFALVHEVMGDLSLPIDDNPLASEFVQVDAMAALV